MAETTAAQLNNLSHDIYFISIDRGLRAPSLGLKPSTTFLGGLFSSFSGQEDEATGNVRKCNRTRKSIKERLGMPYATTSRGLSCLKDKELLAKEGMSTYTFHSSKLEGGKKWHCPTEILTKMFDLFDEEGNVVATVMLTYCTRLVYAYVYTLLPHVGKSRTLEVMFKQIAEDLNIDASTVSDAVKVLRQAKLIYFPKGWNGTNRYKMSKIGLRRNWSWFKKEREYRARLKNKDRKPTAEPKNLNTPKIAQSEPMTRDMYYGELQAVAAQKADRALKKALKNKEFKQVEEELATVNKAYHRAISQNDDVRAQELSVKIDSVTVKRVAVLEKLGLSEDHFKPERYAVCKRCHDTGWLPDGTNCGCFNRGSPPPSVNGKSRKVGELNKI